MLKIGIVGNINAMVHLLQLLKNIRGIQVIGKSSVGMMDQADGKSVSIPEYNRHELFDIADILFIDNSQILQFEILKTAVKNNKHLYFNDLPDLSPDSCQELLKLSEEARTAVYIRNTLMSEPLPYWISKNFQEPACLGFFESIPTLADRKNFLLKYLLYAQMLFGNAPQKTRASGIHHSGTEFTYINLRFDYSSSSSLTLEFLLHSRVTRSLKIAMPGRFLEGNCLTGKASLNLSDFQTGIPAEDSIALFLKGAGTGDFFPESNLGSYYSALHTFGEVDKKMELYTPWL
jgi:hypothetical protein